MVLKNHHQQHLVYRPKKTRRGKCLLREKGYVIGEITALEVAVITYIKRGEG